MLEPVRQRGGLVVELGCGSGLLTRHPLTAGHRVIATDASPAMLDLTRQHALGAEDICQVVLPDDPIPAADAIVSVGHVLNYLPDEPAVDQALAAAPGLCAPQGVWPPPARCLWTADAWDGPAVVELGGRHAQLFSIVDDHSRLICHGGFYPDTCELSFQSCLRTGIARRGLPRRLYVDNGAAFASGQLRLICARLGIQIVHTPPYRPLLTRPKLASYAEPAAELAGLWNILARDCGAAGACLSELALRLERSTCQAVTFRAIQHARMTVWMMVDPMIPPPWRIRRRHAGDAQPLIELGGHVTVPDVSQTLS